MWCRNSDAVPRSESVCASRFQGSYCIAHQIEKDPRELSRTSKTASCTSQKDKLGTNVAQEMLASVLHAASPELLKNKASEAFVCCCVLAPANSLVLYHYKSRFSARDEALVILSQKQNAEPHPRPTPRRRGAKKPRTGLRHRPEKGGEGATPARR